MAIADSSLIFIGVSAVPRPLFNTNNGGKFRATSAKRTDDYDSTSSTQANRLKIPSLRLRVSNPLLARSVVSVLGLGFVDAGYEN